MSDIEQITESFRDFFPLIIIAGILVLALMLKIIQPSSEEIAENRMKAEEEKKARMQTVTVEDVKAIEDTKNSGSGMGLVMMDGHVGMGTRLGGSGTKTVIKRYVYLRDNANRLIQFNVSEADDYAAISCLKGKEITVEMFADGCIWQDRIRLKNKFVVES